MGKRFTAATWNVLYETKPGVLAPKLDALLNQHGVSLLLMQEMSHPDVMNMVRDAGLKAFRHAPQYVVAWKPDHWTKITAQGIALAQTPFYRKGSDRPVITEAAKVILSDDQGRTVTAMSYHTPSSVQTADPPANRIQALREAAETWREEAKKAKTHACLFGGDDNVDERLSHGPWDFLSNQATGLRQVRAPGATIGKVRRIDDFRVKGLKPKQGKVLPGGGDHRIHVRTFVWQ